MDALFWIGQVGWLAFLACGAYISFCFWSLSDEESSRTAEVRQRGPRNAMPANDLRASIIATLK